MLASRLNDAITECISEAETSNSEETQQKALQTLVSVTKVSPQNRNFLAHKHGAISTLLFLTKSSSPTLQTLSLSILFNLSLNPDLKKPLASMEAIAHLNNLIISPTTLEEAGRLACSLVCSLAMLDKNKAKFGVSGTVQILVDALSRPKSLSSHHHHHHLLSSLAELVQFHGNCTLAVRGGAVEALLGMAVSSKEGEDLAGTSLAVLSQIARFNEGLKALVRTEGVVGMMAEVMKGGCMMSKEGAAEVMVRVFEESEGCVRDAARLPELSSLLADLSVRGSGKAREKAALLMKKMMEASFAFDDADDHSFFLPW